MSRGLISYMAFPGIESIERGTFTLTQGTTPSVGTLDIQPQTVSTIPLDGTLTIIGGDIKVSFVHCRIDKASFAYGPDGLVWRLSLYCRRWKWRFAGPHGPVSGWFNQRFDTIQPTPNNADQMGTFQLGSLNQDSLLTPQQLAAQLFDALGEEGYDVSALPNDRLPEAVWDMDQPAPLLEELCSRLGCRVVIGLDRANSAKIVRLGVGSALPTENIEYANAVIDAPELPDSIAVIGGRNRYQVDFRLTPVGLDVDGTIKDIWDLSYAPVQYLEGDAKPDPFNLGGWGQIGYPDSEIGFTEIAGWEISDVIPPMTPPNIAAAWQVRGLAPQVNPRQLARQSVWRWYRIEMDIAADGSNAGALIPGWGVPYGSGRNGPLVINGLPNPQAPPGAKKGGKTEWGKRIRALWQVLPLEDVQVVGWYDNTNRFHALAAFVYGKYYSFSWDGVGAGVAANQDADLNFTTPVPVGMNYAIDRERGLVIFDEPMLLFNGQTNAFYPAAIFLRCTVSPRAFATQAPDRFYLERDLGGSNGTGPRLLRHEEIFRNVACAYDKNFNVTALFTNDEAVVAQANYAIDAALLEYQIPAAQDVMYSGIVPIACDGANREVSWAVGPEGAFTRVARNTEVHPAVPPYRERMLLSSLARTTETTRRLQQQSRKQ